MRPRIKQLWDLAAMLEPEPSWEGQKRFMEKFADLVIQECHQVIVVGGVDDLDGVMKHFEIE
jgi:hypothetical protein